MGNKMDKAGQVASMTARIMVSLLWIVAGIIGVAAGQPLVALVVVAYLVYLWLFGGRWLIY